MTPRKVDAGGCPCPDDVSIIVAVNLAATSADAPSFPLFTEIGGNRKAQVVLRADGTPGDQANLQLCQDGQ